MALLVTLLALEGALQVAFPLLPQTLIERMPQYLERSGFRLATEHGAREYPAGQSVEYEITATSGDLFRLTCLSPEHAPPLAAYRVAFQRDAHGFRNPTPQPYGVELAIIGDSFVAAEAIVEPFWRGLSDAMLVLGLPGSGALEQQRLFEAFARPSQPETVVLVYFAGNDLADNAKFAEMIANGESFATRARKDKQILDYSVLFTLAVTLREALHSGGDDACHYPQMALTNPPQPVAFYDEFLPSLAIDAAAIGESERFQATRASIADMADSQSSRGKRFVLLYIPQKAELYWQWLDDSGKSAIVSALSARHAIAHFSAIDNNISAQRDILASLAAELDIEFLDMTQPLAEAIAAGQQPYFFADTHWNQLGHNIARNALLAHLNQSNLES